MDVTRMRQLAGMEVLVESGLPKEPNLVKAGTGKAATTGSASASGQGGLPDEPNLVKAGTGKAATTGVPTNPQSPAKFIEKPDLVKSGTGKAATTGTASATGQGGLPDEPNLVKAGTGKAATTGSKLREDAQQTVEQIVAKVQALASQVVEGQEQFLEYRHDALKRILAMVNKYVD